MKRASARAIAGGPHSPQQLEFEAPAPADAVGAEVDHAERGDACDASGFGEPDEFDVGPAGVVVGVLREQTGDARAPVGIWLVQLQNTTRREVSQCDAQSHRQKK